MFREFLFKKQYINNVRFQQLHDLPRASMFNFTCFGVKLTFFDATKDTFVPAESCLNYEPRITCAKHRDKHQPDVEYQAVHSSLTSVRLILSPTFAIMKKRKNPPRMRPATRIPYSKPIGITQSAVI